MTDLPRKHLFDLPDGVIYLDGNSLGPLPRGAAERAGEVITRQWGQELIRAWNSAGWMELPRRVGDRIAPLIGAAPGTIATGDTLSIKVYQALASALKMRPDRRVILSDSGNFPSDLYMAQGLISTIGKDHELRLPTPEEVIDAITDEVAVVMLTHVDYRSGRIHDMAAITRAAHAAGAVMIWDLAHSAGAVPVDIAGSGAEFAVGCTYKYLNGGPGAPAFIYARPDIVLDVEPALAGWLGHEAPFEMDPAYRPAMSTERLRVGTPPVVQLAILDAALDAWEGIDMADLRAASIALSERFIAEVEGRCPDLTLASPRDPERRGSQVSFAFDHGYAAMRALIDRGVIGDFRAPNLMRFGFTPLYLDEGDVVAAVDILEDILTSGVYREPAYQTKSRVT
ncbi:kynureninase [Ponticoccus sp. SC2-23]|uniref:kynureninase n=1 Tax=Alexandriicola marinus TaxID=2081710 RepID=UPI000FD96EFA|nr:kynureninase [Alexandriicola marinus]MBM1220815.1 kynureninase [Ponticoccus sp. SC6-9]MBM1225385.1 kynureninase [Ponticoccus sp. SC6-15]MBM1227568.1 kynureninase [Ponticoccus sp. SC6-38]MBM1234794.1 kynureninase [Ponticoccus sp. SC6-45]MBM1238070.1 kynureninase [Ponticoccus sp. SC6-49]MBM1244297.1 kynureninase [Ponticoccus sp. SC2-64]MBM1248318.1 kynureninase [Ponticoccus sp. SC6-42]MBM1252470.1 kynureninase [Ponticoccus sp. SC6-33]MBM1256079.1 kynureninase [Ponticoccus sp. SC6-60]MBM1